MIKDLLGVPPEMEVYDAMVLGWPAISPPEKLMRETDKMIHWDRQETGAFRSDEEVREYVRKARSWTIGAHSRKVKS